MTQKEIAEIIELCNVKDQTNMTWRDIAEAVKSTYGIDHDESYYRLGRFKKAEKCENVSFDDLEKLNKMEEERKTLTEALIELQKEKVKMRDERNEYARILREQSRRESFLELVERVFESKTEPFGVIETKITTVNQSNDMIVCLSDAHTGMSVKNSWNEYDTAVLRTRLNTYASKIINIRGNHGCEDCYVVIGGDMISGLIHNNLRLQSNENVIEQVKIVTDYIAMFLQAILPYFNKVYVYSVSGNHSRLSPNKEDHLKGEELDALIPFILKVFFKNNQDKIYISESNIDSTICAFETRYGRLFYAVHGDKDTPSKVISSLSLMTKHIPDCVIMGHRHHNCMSSEHGVKVVQCGSLIGTDDYCVDHRITGNPEQTIIITGEQPIICLYDIQL